MLIGAAPFFSFFNLILKFFKMQQKNLLKQSTFNKKYNFHLFSLPLRLNIILIDILCQI